MRAGDKGSETRDGKAERYNVMNLFMQYNLAHSDYNSAKFNWIVYSQRSRYDQSKRGPRCMSLPYFASFSPIPALARRETKEASSNFFGSRECFLRWVYMSERATKNVRSLLKFERMFTS